MNNEKSTFNWKSFTTGVALTASIAAAIATGVFVHNRCKTRGKTAMTPREGYDNFLGKKPIPKELTLTKDTPGVFFGENPGKPGTYVGKPLKEDGHVCVIGSSGTGKTTSIVNPTMEIADGFTVYFDIKQTIAKRWDELHGKSGKRRLLFNPCNDSESNCWYDVFAPLKADPDNLEDHARKIATALIPERPDDHNAIWTKTAVAFTTGAIIYGYHRGNTFIETMKWITDNSVSDIVDEIMKDKDTSAHKYVSKLIDMEERVIAGIGMELETYLTPFSASRAICKALSQSKERETLDWSSLNGRTPFDVILVFPEAELNVLQPLLCLMTKQLLESLTRRPERTHDKNELPPVLLMAEEFPRLGKVEALENSVATLRSRGVTIVLFLQSFASLDKIYGEESARIIRENCVYQVMLGCMDVESQRYFSDLIGTVMVEMEGTSEGASISMGPNFNFGRNYSLERVPLVQPHMLRSPKNPIVCAPNGTFTVKKRPAFNDERIFAVDSCASTKNCGSLNYLCALAIPLIYFCYKLENTLN